MKASIGTTTNIFFHIHNVQLDIIEVFRSPTDAQVNCLKSNFQCTLKLTLKPLRHISVQSHHHQGAHYSCLLKLQLLKQPIKIHRCVVMWLYILVGSC